MKMDKKELMYLINILQTLQINSNNMKTLFTILAAAMLLLSCEKENTHVELSGTEWRCEYTDTYSVSYAFFGDICEKVTISEGMVSLERIEYNYEPPKLYVDGGLGNVSELAIQFGIGGYYSRVK